MTIAPRDYAVMPSRVLIALLQGTPEERCITALAGMPSRVVEHRNRTTLLGRLRSYRPTVLVLPLLDRRSRPSSALVDPCHAVLPSLHIVIVSGGVSQTRHLLRALQQEVTVLMQPSDEQLRSVVLQAAFPAHSPLPNAQELFERVNPPFLRRVLKVAWMMSDQRVGLAFVASHIGTSTRTLEREAIRQKVSSPRDILAAVRFLRAYAIATASKQQATTAVTGVLEDQSALYEPGSPLPPLLRVVDHHVRALGGSIG